MTSGRYRCCFFITVLLFVFHSDAGQIYKKKNIPLHCCCWDVGKKIVPEQQIGSSCVYNLNES